MTSEKSPQCDEHLKDKLKYEPCNPRAGTREAWVELRSVLVIVRCANVQTVAGIPGDPVVSAAEDHGHAHHAELKIFVTLTLFVSDAQVSFVLRNKANVIGVLKIQHHLAELT